MPAPSFALSQWRRLAGDTLRRIAPWFMRWRRMRQEEAALRRGAAPTDRYRRLHLPSEPWIVDHYRVLPDEFQASGWAMPPIAIFDPEPRILVNGRVPRVLQVRQARPDVAYAFWQREHAIDAGFVLQAFATDGPLFPGGYLELSYPNSASKLPRGLRQSHFLFDPALEPPMPSEDQRYRVIGDRKAEGFRMSGATDFQRLDAAFRAFTGKGVAQAGTVLDWGVGCGRVARYASRERPEGIWGCDIDAQNVAWCAASLPGRYTHSGLRPPLPYDDASIDILYGVSVFTHLREPLQDVWLAELRRVLKRGGHAFVTVHGVTAVDFANTRPPEYQALREVIAREGLFFSSANDQLDGAVDHEGEYVNVFHDAAYIRSHWGRFLQVAAIIPGYLYTHDVVVLRRA